MIVHCVNYNRIESGQPQVIELAIMELSLNTYKLHRESGIIVFNSFSDGERYWMAYQSSDREGGRSMYDEISRSDFDNVIVKKIGVRDLFSKIYKNKPGPRPLDVDLEISKESKYALRHAISVHKLQQGAGQWAFSSTVTV